jgi:hypothetical protein
MLESEKGSMLLRSFYFLLLSHSLAGIIDDEGV